MLPSLRLCCVCALCCSIQRIPEIPAALKALYKTVWEVPQKVLIDMAADRAAFIDQSQSLNVFMAEPTFGKMSSMHFYAWRKGLKTGMYYLRARPKADAIQFTVDQGSLAQRAEDAAAAAAGPGTPVKTRPSGGSRQGSPVKPPAAGPAVPPSPAKLGPDSNPPAAGAGVRRSLNADGPGSVAELWDRALPVPNPVLPGSKPAAADEDGIECLSCGS